MADKKFYHIFDANTPMISPTSISPVISAAVPKIRAASISLFDGGATKKPSKELSACSSQAPAAVPPQKLQGGLSGKNDQVHGKFIGPEMRVEKVYSENKPDRQERFVAVDYGGDIDDPSREKPRKEFRKPKDKPVNR